MGSTVNAPRFQLPLKRPSISRPSGEWNDGNYDVFRRQGLFIDKIFKGAKPGDLPVQQPTKFDLMLNLKTAKALDLAIPPSLLALADEVIE